MIWGMSPECLAYAARMRAEHEQPTRTTPFDPCDRFRRLPDSCAICAHTMDALPCPDLREVFLDAFSEMEGGDLSAPGVNDGSLD